jgi:hypothetical protein
MGHHTFNAPMIVLRQIKESNATLGINLGMRSKDCIITAVPRVHVIIDLGFRQDANINSHLMHGTKCHVQIAISATSNI